MGAEAYIRRKNESTRDISQATHIIRLDSKHQTLSDSIHCRENLEAGDRTYWVVT